LREVMETTGGATVYRETKAWRGESLDQGDDIGSSRRLLKIREGCRQRNQLPITSWYIFISFLPRPRISFSLFPPAVYIVFKPYPVARLFHIANLTFLHSDAVIPLNDFPSLHSAADYHRVTYILYRLGISKRNFTCISISFFLFFQVLGEIECCKGSAWLSLILQRLTINVLSILVSTILSSGEGFFRISTRICSFQFIKVYIDSLRKLSSCQLVSWINKSSNHYHKTVSQS
jgi:hypothetical protein